MDTQLEQFTLSPATRLPRIWIGLWQLSSNAWGSAPAQKVRDAMATHLGKGYLAFGKSGRFFQLLTLLTVPPTDMVSLVRDHGTPRSHLNPVSFQHSGYVPPF